MDSLEQDLYWYQACKKDMTYILGARCKDGVVLVGDTKVTVSGGTDYTYSKKLMVEPLKNVVMGSAGIGGLYGEFQNRIKTKVTQIAMTKGSNKLLINTEDGFLVLITKVIREMLNDYGKDSNRIAQNFNILCVTRIHPKAKLTAYTGFGIQEPVNDFRSIGHGKLCVSLFHKKMWNKDMTIEQTAKLGIFLIQLIQDMELDASVGFKNSFLPQVVYIPDIKFPKDFPKNPPQDEGKKAEFQKQYNKILKEQPIEELTNDKVKNIIDENNVKVKEFKTYIKGLL